VELENFRGGEFPEKITHVSIVILQGNRAIIAAMNGTDCIPILRALGEINRMRIVRLLADEPLGVCEIAGRLEISQYNASKHLRILRDAGLLEMKQQGKHRLHTVTAHLRSRLAANKNVLELGCCCFRFDQLPK